MNRFIVVSIVALASAACAAPAPEDAEASEGEINGTPSAAKLREIQDAYRAARPDAFHERAKPLQGPIVEAIADADARDCGEWVWEPRWVARPARCHTWKLFEWRAGTTKYWIVEVKAVIGGAPSREFDYRTHWSGSRTVNQVWIFTFAPEPTFVMTGDVSADETQVYWRR